MYFIENVSYEHAVRVQFIGYRDVLFWGFFCLKSKKNYAISIQVSYKCWMKQVCTQKMRWGRRAARPGNDTQGGMTVGVCRNLMAHEGCRDCWFRLRCTLDDRWKCARKQTRHCTRLGKQHGRSPSASTYSPLAPHVRTDNGRRWKARLIEMIIDRWVPSMWKTKAESRFFFFFFSIHTHFYFLLGLDLPGRRTMWK